MNWVHELSKKNERIAELEALLRECLTSTIVGAVASNLRDRIERALADGKKEPL
jgi:hypothetical protein